MSESFNTTVEQYRQLLAEMITAAQGGKPLEVETPDETAEHPEHPENLEQTETVAPAWPHYIAGLSASLAEESEKPFALLYPWLRDTFDDVLSSYYHLDGSLAERLFIPYHLRRKDVAERIFDPLLALPYIDPSFRSYGRSIYQRDERREPLAEMLYGAGTAAAAHNELLEKAEDYRALGLKNNLLLFMYNLELLGRFPLPESQFSFISECARVVCSCLQVLLNLQASSRAILDDLPADDRYQFFRAGDFMQVVAWLRGTWLPRLTGLFHDAPAGAGLPALVRQLEKIGSEAESPLPMDFSGDPARYDAARTRRDAMRTLLASLREQLPSFLLSRLSTYYKNFFYGVRRLADYSCSQLMAQAVEERFRELGYTLYVRVRSDGALAVSSFFKDTMPPGPLARLVDLVTAARYEKPGVSGGPGNAVHTAAGGGRPQRNKAVSLSRDQFSKIVIKSYDRLISFLEKELGLKIQNNGEIETYLAGLDIKQKIRGKYVEDFEMLSVSRANKYILYKSFAYLYYARRRVKLDLTDLRYFTPYYLSRVQDGMRSCLGHIRRLEPVIELVNIPDRRLDDFQKAVKLFDFNTERLGNYIRS
jgi:hypothetical protein